MSTFVPVCEFTSNLHRDICKHKLVKLGTKAQENNKQRQNGPIESYNIHNREEKRW